MSAFSLHLRPAAAADLDAVAVLAVGDPASWVTPERFREDLAASSYRPAWTWLAADDDGVAARAIWWGRPHHALPVALDDLCVHPRIADPAAVGAALLRAGLAALGAAGLERPPLYELHLPGGWRDAEALAAGVAWRRQAAAAVGMTDELERLQVAWTGGPTPVASGRLRLDEADDATFLALFARVAAGSLDVTTRRTVAAHGADAAARDDLAFYRDAPGERSWWRVARTPDGAAAGFVIPSATDRGPNVGYLGIVPEARGQGLVDDLLAEAVRSHASRGATRITATTDATNTPMAAAFARAGFAVYERRLVLSAPVAAAT